MLIGFIVEIVLHLLEVHFDGTVIFLFDIDKVHDVAVLINLACLGVLVRTVYPADGLEQSVLLGVSEQVHLFEPGHIVARGEHLVNNQDVRLECLAERLLCLFVDVAAWSIFVRNDQSRFERGNIFVKPLLDLASLRVRGAYNHSTDGRISVHKAEVQEVGLYKLTEAADIRPVRSHSVFLGINLGLFKLKISMDIRPDGGINLLPFDAEGVSVRDGFVVEILMDVVSKFQIGTLLFGKKRSTSHSDVDGVVIHQHQILEELTCLLIRAMGFVHEEDALNFGIVHIADLRECIGEFLNIHHHDFTV